MEDSCKLALQKFEFEEACSDGDVQYLGSKTHNKVLWYLLCQGHTWRTLGANTVCTTGNKTRIKFEMFLRCIFLQGLVGIVISMYMNHIVSTIPGSGSQFGSPLWVVSTCASLTEEGEELPSGTK